MEDRIEITINEGVADVRLVRSDKMNALDDRMFTALAAAGEQLANSPEVRVVVLSGEGILKYLHELQVLSKLVASHFNLSKELDMIKDLLCT